MNPLFQHLRRLTAAAVVLFLLAAMTPPVLADAAQEPFRCLTLEELQDKFPEGKYWNGGDPDRWTETPCTHHGNCPNGGGCGCNSFMGLSIQCMGFAEKLGYDATGFNPRENKNGWYTYKSSSALQNLKPGDIVRRNGHSMYVIGVDGENVTIADCNSKDRSCNIRWGGTVTKSNLSVNFEEVRSAPFPLALSYSDLCQRYSSNGIVTISQEATLYSSPCTTQIQEDSIPVTTAPAGSQWGVTRLYLNPAGEYWYKTNYAGTTCYLYAGNGTFAGSPGKVAISGVSAPVDQAQGVGFPIQGQISTATLALTKVGAYIYENSTNTLIMPSEDTPAGKYSYSIYGSVVDKQLTFGALELGNYTYAIKAWVENHHANGGNLTVEENEVLLYQSTFSVHTKPCSHSFTAINDGQSLQAYRCSKCSYGYTVTVYATDYMALCQRYLSHGTVTVCADTSLYTLPSQNQGGSQVLCAAPSGSQWQVTGLVANSQGQYWYESVYHNLSCYLFAGDGLFQPDNGSITISGVSAPDDTYFRSGFPIAGVISSDTLPLTRVGAYIYEGSTDKLILSSEDTPTGHYSYSIRNNTVDKQLTFGSLAMGSYIYAIKASVTNHHANGGTLTAEETEVLLYESTFAVNTSNCSHSYQSQETAAATCTQMGLTTHTCSDCGYAYTVTVFPNGKHSYGDWMTELAPTYAEKGLQSRTCVHCGAVESQSLPLLQNPVTQWNITLGDSIGVSFRVTAGADIQVTVDGEETPCTVQEDVVTVKLAATQMTDAIALRVDGVTLPETYSVRQYAQTILSGDYDDATKALVEAMLLYGGAAQAYFEHNTQSLASEGLSGELPVPERKVAARLSGKLDNLSYYGATLLHENKIAVRIYFQGSLKGLTFTVNGTAVAPAEKDGMYYVEVAQINPQALADAVTVTVTDGSSVMTVRYSPMDYIVRMYYRADSQAATKTLVQALYGYHLAAKAYTA